MYTKYYYSTMILFRLVCLFFFKQKTAYEMRISDWSSDVCSSDLKCKFPPGGNLHFLVGVDDGLTVGAGLLDPFVDHGGADLLQARLQFRARRLHLHATLDQGGLGFLGLDLDRKSVVSGKRVSVRVDLGGRRIIKKKHEIKNNTINIRQQNH